MNVFIAGPRAISRLNKDVMERLNNIIKNNFTVLVGDANGVDKQIQEFCHSLNYNKVRVFASNGKARNNIGEWEVYKVDVDRNVKGFDFYAAKDLEMAKKADYGFMIWNGKSKGTLNNIHNLVNLNKKVLVYFTPDKQFYTIRSLNDVNKLGNKSNKNSDIDNGIKKNEQMSLFK
ncbi:hypothetical protein MXL46_07230 [Heyndrickxia sporothermodurans]|uniref:Uncharacterized protein n=1 Tax=Heyndrickxia sporothermodurans TaxID=46224 RepID=A0A150L0Q0_9BACI|nr:hypothetical protein [Heyndrickxia sporothermodurans]KYD05526.1 hypothetical protein B4102_3250 [Heyndrickxia sporothermodurans]MBL5772843.1 hypothetical protein [Heyndrickxia sporothermodurans]MBL5779861.1 hypothetical protein [Heyndrickxia sporothermodurans]MBL5782240.1 hypothetical protein [Heyndrickxia sporothermodurans]MBL5790540.1 hypothetical protein [Heyndrickxia sporothermodurans]